MSATLRVEHHTTPLYSDGRAVGKPEGLGPYLVGAVPDLGRSGLYLDCDGQTQFQPFISGLTVRELALYLVGLHVGQHPTCRYGLTLIDQAQRLERSPP